MLRALDAAGVGPGCELRVTDAADAASVALTIDVGGASRTIAHHAAADICISA